MDIVVVCNKEAKQYLIYGSPDCLQKLQRSIPGAVWEKIKISRERTWITPPTMFAPNTFKSKREDVTSQERGQHFNVYLQPWDPLDPH
jgi:hypothetical protein